MDTFPKISVIIHMDGANRDFFRSTLESITQSTYRNFEVIITDAGAGDAAKTIASEFFPEPGMLTYMKVKHNRPRGYMLNYACTLAKGDYFLFFDRHSRLSPIALFEIAKAVKKVREESGENKKNDYTLIYSDNDEIIGDTRTNLDYKPDGNIELIRHRNYIGDIFAISRDAAKITGLFHDALKYASGYDLILRCFEKKCNVVHIPKLLYSKRILQVREDNRIFTTRLEEAYKEHLNVAQAHLMRMRIEGKVVGTKHTTFWKIKYNGSDYRAHRGEYLVVRGKRIKVRLRDAIPKMYGILKQNDVGIVGGIVTMSPFSIHNCGYIFSDKGDIYPACYGQSVLYDGYNYRCVLPCDVSLVDFDFCLIKRKVYKGLGGFDKNLSGQQMMLDFCLRAKKAGYRTVFTPDVRSRRRGDKSGLEDGNPDMIFEKWPEIISGGDPYYNVKLPMGLDNYFLL